MGRLASRIFLCCLLFRVFTRTTGQQSQCEDGWFGDKCQYLCHCLNNAVCDKVTGECPGVCDKGWFGPQCQYRDAAFTTNKIALTDGDDFTCLTGPALTQNFPLSQNVKFTWMRIVTSKPGMFDLVTMTFTSNSGVEVAPKSPLTKINVSDTILELYGEFQDRIKSIKLHFDTRGTRESFCTMQVSSGRNVAIKQKAYQTNTYLGGAEKAVDGKSSRLWNGSICSSTEQNDNPYWTLDLSLSVTVNMYTLIGAMDNWVLCRLRYFRLDSYFQSTKVQQYNNSGTVEFYSYVYSERTSAITSITLTVSRDRWPNNNITCDDNRISLSFCEMQIFGDVVCQPGKWGRDCEKDCNCQDPSESCFISTGMCPTGCKAGFRGPGCQEECFDGRWGANCLNSCGKCLNEHCNKASGDCRFGCIPGYKVPRCVEKCDRGTYGYNCNQTCLNCLNNMCDNVDGTCNKCVAGYQGPKCEQECNHGTYGYNCNEGCATNCLNNICDNVDGTCTQCVAGYKGPKCEEECNPIYYGEGCAQQCSDKCKDQLCHHITGVCDDCPDGIQLSKDCSKKCDPGSYGYNCSLTCPTNCLNNTCDNVDGTCTQCVAGYQGSKCEQECKTRYFGEGCAQQCSDKCNDQLCHHITGACHDCPDGIQLSKDCSKECDPGVYGYNCSQVCSANCLTYKCDNVDGTCTKCGTGYQGPKCEQACSNNTYGEDCKQTCSLNCVANATQEAAVCGHVQGQCLLGCVSGYSGITCEEIPSDQDEINPVIIVVPILLVIILVAVVILGILFWRRRKSQKNERKERGPIPTGTHNGIENKNKAKRSSGHPSTSNTYEMAKDIHTYEEISEDQVDVYMNTPETQAKFSKTAIPVESLGEYLASHNLEFFTAQFQTMPECYATTKAAESSENKPKNRYKNILAYDHSRVRLHVNSEKKQGEYYNANFIQGFDGAKYIASQGPNKAVLADFIRMIWEQDVELVVMLTKVVEDGKAKCESYWPTQDASEVTFGEIKVVLAATQVLADYTKRTLQLTKNDGESRFVTQYHFTSWPDKGVPMTPWALVDFEQVVDYHYDTEKPLLVHCSAGVGRTGTFIALRNALKEAKATGYVDFYQTVTKMRQDRVFMIQTLEQYCFLHDAVQVALLCQDALMTTEALDNRMKVLMEVTETGQTNIEKEFKMVCDLVKKEIGNDTENEATEYVNIKETDQNFLTNIKNRFPNVLAKKEHRPKLTFDPENEYINAVLVPSMTKQEHQLLTQLPLPTTVEDFWRLVTLYNVSLIVAFDSDEQNDESVGDYLPKDNNPLKCGQFEITKDMVIHGDFWEKEKIHVQTKGKMPCLVHHIKCIKSKLDTKDWLLFTKELHSMAPLGDDRTLYMCMNGADQSGFACVVSLLINRVEHDHFLTVPLVVGEIKSIRPEVIPNKDQYCSLYNILQLHCDTSHVYTNHTPHSLRNMHNGRTHHSKPGHVYTNTIVSDETEKSRPHQKMPVENKASANVRPSVGKSKARESQPVSSPEQALSKQNLEPHDGQGYSELL